MLLNKGANLLRFSKEIFAHCKGILVDNIQTSEHKLEAVRVAALTTQWLYLSARLTASAAFNKDYVGSASVDYLHFSGYVTMAHFWLRMMEVAAQKLKADPTGPQADFYRTKIMTGKFYFATLLPRTKSLAASMVKHPRTIMKITEEQFLTR